MLPTLFQGRRYSSRVSPKITASHARDEPTPLLPTPCDASGSDPAATAAEAAWLRPSQWMSHAKRNSMLKNPLPIAPPLSLGAPSSHSPDSIFNVFACSTLPIAHFSYEPVVNALLRPGSDTIVIRLSSSSSSYDDDDDDDDDEGSRTFAIVRRVGDLQASAAEIRGAGPAPPLNSVVSPRSKQRSRLIHELRREDVVDNDGACRASEQVIGMCMSSIE